MPKTDPTIILQLCTYVCTHTHTHFAQSLLSLLLIQSLETGLSLSPTLLSSTFLHCWVLSLLYLGTITIQCNDAVNILFIFHSTPKDPGHFRASTGTSSLRLSVPLLTTPATNCIYLTVSKVGLYNGTN